MREACWFGVEGYFTLDHTCVQVPAQSFLLDDSEIEVQSELERRWASTGAATVKTASGFQSFDALF